MKITGIADEAAPDLLSQIKVHKELGWNLIEIRNISGVNITQIDNDDFERSVDLLERKQMKVVCFSSAIANWARPVSGNFKIDVADLKRAAPRMHRLNTKFIRIMSYPDGGLKEKDWEKEVFRRIKELVRIAEGEGVILLHENCDGWASASPENQRKLLDEINSGSLQIVFDIGNPVAHGAAEQETWDFYESAKPFIKHVHVKDCLLNERGGVIHVYPDEGLSMVQKICTDLIRSDYIGAFSIEPHMVEIHLLNKTFDINKARSIYLTYARKTEKLLNAISVRASRWIE